MWGRSKRFNGPDSVAHLCISLLRCIYLISSFNLIYYCLEEINILVLLSLLLLYQQNELYENGIEMEGENWKVICLFADTVVHVRKHLERG